MKKVTKAIKALNSLSDEERLELEEYLKQEEDEVVEVKKEEIKEVKEIKEEVKKDFVTNDQLTGILEQLLQKVALKDEVEEIKVDKKKAKEFGVDGKPIVQEGDNRDNRLAKILADFN